MNSVFNTILQRTSVRSFTPIVSNQVSEKLVKLAETAPSAGDLKSYVYEVITNEEIIKKIAKSTDQPWIESASIVIKVKIAPKKVMEKYGDRGYLYSIQDATIFLTYLDLLCVEKGLGTCWVGGFDPKKVKALTLLVIGGKS